MLKLLALGATSLLGLALAAAIPPPPPEESGGPPPPPPKKGDRKAEGGPAGDLRKAYHLLRRLRADQRDAGRPEGRLRDWAERAAKLYRDGLRAHESGDPRLAHEYGAAAHDLARVVDHARNASLTEPSDSDLPPPPPGAGLEDEARRVRKDLRHTHDRIRDGLDRDDVSGSRYYLDAARDLYNAARRDAEAGRSERAGELARAAEAMTHVPEHLGHARDAGENREPPKRKAGRPEPKRPPRPGDDRPDPKGERSGDDLPPPL